MTQSFDFEGRLGRRAVRLFWTLAATSSGVFGFSAACSNSFGACAENRTCEGSGNSDGSDPETFGASSEMPGANGHRGGSTGKGGSDTAAGIGGDTSIDTGGDTSSGASGNHMLPASGGAPNETPVECNDASECDDHDGCNGAETCIDHECVPGDSPCTNPDEAHCAVSCENDDGGAICDVSALDKDGDDFGTPLCVADPGDDCDDDDEDVNPDADEQCDLIDNDCDGKIDMEDGLTVGGTVVTLKDTAYGSTTNMWGPVVHSNAGSGHSVLWIDTSNRLQVTSVDDSGGQPGPDLRVSSASTEPVYGADMVEGHGAMAYVWSFSSNRDIRFKTGSTTVTLPDGGSPHEPRITATASGWVVAGLVMTFIDTDYDESAGPLEKAYGLAAIGDHILAVDSDSQNVYRRQFEVGAALAVSISMAGPSDDVGKSPAIASSGTYWGIAWQDDPTSGEFGVYNSSGTKKCDVSFATEAEARFTVFYGASLFHVMASYNGGAIEILRFNDACKSVGGRGEIRGSTGVIANAGGSIGPNRVAFAWREDISGVSDALKLRITGKNICD